MNSEKDGNVEKREQEFMADFATITNIDSMLSPEQDDSFHRWKDSNGVRNLKIKETSTMIYIEGEGHLQGVHIGTLSIQFVNSKNMAEKYKARIADGFVKFVAELVGKGHNGDRS